MKLAGTETIKDTAPMNNERGWHREWAIADSRRMDAENLLAEAATFIANLKVGVTVDKRDEFVTKIEKFLLPATDHDGHETG